MVELTRQICEREGLGDVLAEGPYGAIKAIGKGCEQYMIHVKGQPFPMHTPRMRHGQALGYAVSPTGADHMHNMWDDGLTNDPLPEGMQELGLYESLPRHELSARKVRAYKTLSTAQWIHNHLGNCMFMPWSRDQLVDIVRAITGWRTNIYELLQAAERGVTMARAFNLREGLTRKDDVLPLRMNTPYVNTTLNEKPVDPEILDESISTFYEMMGWDPETGKPTLTRLQELDIEWVAEFM
jgi:aldehyde:ferredoxin oxidoreductase